MSNQYDDYYTRPQATASHRASQPKSASAMAITGLVLGIIALLTSFIPIINNFSFFLGLLGIIFAIIGLIATLRGTRNGKAIAIAALVVNVLACGAVLATQSAYSNALKEATNGPSVTSASNTGSNSAAQGYTDLPVGTSITLANGLTVTVDYVDPSRTNYDGSQITAVGVTYTNGGSSEQSFNMYNWKGQDTQGAQRTGTYYSGGDGNALNSGTLAAGGTVSGEVYFDGTLSKVLYYASMIGDSTASWAVS